MNEQKKTMVIGITPALIHGDDKRDRYGGRPLLFVEQSMAEWVMSHGEAVPMMIPAASPSRDPAVGADQFAEAIDGLIIQGGVDVAPESYGEEPIDSRWQGDAVRDRYELEIVDACFRRDRPILGICRGHQLLNVTLGGTLFQDIATEVDGALNHRDPALYHENTHQVVFESGAALGQLYGAEQGLVNSVHHQAIKTVGDGLCVEATCPEDGVVEAVRFAGSNYAVGVQWHPEFQESHQSELLSTRPLLSDFLEAVKRRLHP